MPNRLFGTDGVRGVANVDLTATLAYRLGMGAVSILGPRIVVGRDTRRSGSMLESALQAGIMAAGGTPLCAGVIPTPAVALLTRVCGADGGVVISASHNPPEYNGIKFFGPDGMKASDEAEDALADFVEVGYLDQTFVPGEGVGKLEKLKDACEVYINHAIDSIDVRLDGLRVVVDCAHGASCRTTPAALERLGAEAFAFNTDFDGMDINVGCGSTHLEPLRAKMAEVGADLGVAHDGDADRVLFVDASGNEVDGDRVLAICATDMASRGELANNEVVSTVMCNLGFVRAMGENGIEVAQTAVGDRFVLQRMLADGAVIGGEQSGHIIFLNHNTTGDGLVTALQLIQTAVGDRFVLQRMLADGAVIGGEQSGHIIFLNHNTTGDGLVTALQLMAVMKRSGKSLAELARVMRRFPQSLVNVRTARKDEHGSNTAVVAAVAAETETLGDAGRVLVRASGTEPLVRVMVEAATEELATDCAERIAAVMAAETETLGDAGRVLVRASGTEPLVRVMVEAATEELATDCAERIAAVIRAELDGE